MSAPTFAIGDRVRLTAKFLRSTGSNEGHVRWTVTGFSGSFVIVDEPVSRATRALFTKDEIRQDPTLLFRRFNPANIELSPVRR